MRWIKALCQALLEDWGAAQMPALAQLEVARKKQGPPHTSTTALSEAAQGLALAAAKAVVDGSCSGNPRSSQPPPAFAGPPHYVSHAVGIVYNSRQQSWTVRGEDCHQKLSAGVSCLCAQRKPGRLAEGQPHIYKATVSHCGQQLRWW